MKAVNPATEELIRDYPEPSPAEVDDRVAAAERAFGGWRRTGLSERSERFRRLASLLRRERIDLARGITQEMGKPIAASEAEIEKCALLCEFYADRAAGFLAPSPVATDATRSYVRYDPLGPILAVMPWNFPFWQVFRFAVPAMMAGNVGLLKHASNVPGTALAIEDAFRRAGFPQGVMTALLISGQQVEDLIARPEIRAVTLTGSERAGAVVAARAGRHLKKTVLELGGSDPFLVLSDADPAHAARLAVESRTVNSGQSCIAAKRFIVEPAVAEEFVAAMIQGMEQVAVGDPMNPRTVVGPLAREDLLEGLHDQVRRSVQAGAELRTGGRRLPGRGYFYAPTVLDRVEPGMAAFDEETFGPVAALCRAKDREHAIALANRTPFGLGATIVAGDAAAAEPLAARIEAGLVFINGIVKSDPRLPFGGVKRSGYGRELSEFGIREFVNIKTVWVNHPE
jgi:succinate-semialdehyde dehydrogenase/glutarate-semialdehyde dehydrogenase